MNISFDVFNEHPELEKGLDSNEHVFYKSYLNFVAKQLEPLKEEIEKEESTDNTRFTEIHILHEDRGPMTFHNYSKELIIEMKQSFTEKDFEKFKSDLENNQRGFHN